MFGEAKEGDKGYGVPAVVIEVWLCFVSTLRTAELCRTFESTSTSTNATLDDPSTSSNQTSQASYTLPRWTTKIRSGSLVRYEGGRQKRNLWRGLGRGSLRYWIGVKERRVSDALPNSLACAALYLGILALHGLRTLTSLDMSITAHSGALRGMYKSLGLPHRALSTGEMNVLVIQVTEIEDSP